MINDKKNKNNVLIKSQKRMDNKIVIIGGVIFIVGISSVFYYYKSGKKSLNNLVKLGFAIPDNKQVQKELIDKYYNIQDLNEKFNKNSLNSKIDEYGENLKELEVYLKKPNENEIAHIIRLKADYTVFLSQRLNIQKYANKFKENFLACNELIKSQLKNKKNKFLGHIEFIYLWHTRLMFLVDTASSGLSFEKSELNKFIDYCENYEKKFLIKEGNLNFNNKFTFINTNEMLKVNDRIFYEIYLQIIIFTYQIIMTVARKKQQSSEYLKNILVKMEKGGLNDEIYKTIKNLYLSLNR